MNIQQLFEKSVTGVLNQGCQSFTDGSCSLRGDNGNMCAIGHLIDDPHYDPLMEGLTIYDLEVKSAVESSIGRQLLEEDISLINMLMNYHDTSHPKAISFIDNFTKACLGTGNQLGLDTNFLTK